LMRGNQDCKIKHSVVRGDTLSGIAQKYKVSLASLRRLNKGLSDFIVPGRTVVCIPESGVLPKDEKKAKKEAPDKIKKIESKELVPVEKLAPSKDKIDMSKLPALQKKHPSSPKEVFLAAIWSRQASNIMLDPLLSFGEKIERIKRGAVFIPNKKAKYAKLPVVRGMTKRDVANMGLRIADEQILMAGRDIAVTSLIRDIRIRLSEKDIKMIDEDGISPFLLLIQTNLGLSQNALNHLSKKYSSGLLSGMLIIVPGDKL
jgi:LysM repeat protein